MNKYQNVIIIRIYTVFGVKKINLLRCLIWGYKKFYDDRYRYRERTIYETDNVHENCNNVLNVRNMVEHVGSINQRMDIQIFYLIFRSTNFDSIVLMLVYCLQKKNSQEHGLRAIRYFYCTRFTTEVSETSSSSKCAVN